mmetsp:Transcript_14417/g.27839  ORF Transcript_14417/g.27839 Transcript_14417/m.27839 type:complete len:271 (-) Transcript_14417:559-1371(-)
MHIDALFRERLFCTLIQVAFGRLHDPLHTQPVLLGELKVPLVVCRHCHDSPAPVRSQNIVCNPNRDLFPVHWIDRIRSSEDSRFRLLQLRSFQVALLLRFVHVLFHLVLVLLRADLLHQLILGRQHAVGCPEEGVRPRSEHFHCRVIHVLYFELNLCAFRLSNPVSLHFFDGVAPIQVIQVLEKPLCVVRDSQHPLLHRYPDDRVAASLAQAVDHLLVREDSPKSRTPVDWHLCLVGQPLLKELEEDPLRPLVVVWVGRAHLARPIEREP